MVTTAARQGKYAQISKGLNDETSLRMSGAGDNQRDFGQMESADSVAAFVSADAVRRTEKELGPNHGKGSHGSTAPIGRRWPARPGGLGLSAPGSYLLAEPRGRKAGAD